MKYPIPIYWYCIPRWHPLAPARTYRKEIPLFWVRFEVVFARLMRCLMRLARPPPRGVDVRHGLELGLTTPFASIKTRLDVSAPLGRKWARHGLDRAEALPYCFDAF